MLKIVHVSSSISGGAGKAALYLHKALLAESVDSNLILLGDACNADVGNGIHFFNNAKTSFFGRLIRWLQRFLHFYCTRLTVGKSRQYYMRLSRSLSSELSNRLWALPFSGYPVHNHPLLRDADIIHLHWCINFVDIPSFFRSARCPVVWTFHDSWGCRGLANIAFYEHNYSKALISLDSQIRELKKKCYLGAKYKPHLIAPSIFMKRNIEESVITEGLSISVIPNTIGLEADISKCDRMRRSGPLRMLFISAHLSDPHKGFEIAYKAANYLGEKVHLTAVGHPMEGVEESSNLRLVGTIGDARSVFQFFDDADVLVIPSLDDNLPNVMLEAFSIGMPVIALPTGGICEHVIDGINGILANDHTPEALVVAVEKFMLTADVYSPAKIIAFWQERFAPTVVAKQHMQLYQSLLFE